jgi:nucleoside-diphosphate-sugar epimerase
MKIILVTGALDYLGSHLCAKLLKTGHEVLNTETCNKKHQIHKLN